MSIRPELSLDIASLRSGFASGELTPEDVLESVCARIEGMSDNPVWIDRFTRAEMDQQLAAARDRLRRGIAQPLLGIPFAVKDNIDVAGHRTTAACPDFAYHAKQSAAVVTRLCNAGAILVGKTNLDQFATGLVGTRSPYGACQNPFDERYISGGSSSGSAVAVSTGLVSFALGTDTAGSGRVPAGFCNIVGLKPSRGLISCAGVVPACKSLDCVSIFALNCPDARAVFDVAARFDPADPYSRERSELSSSGRSRRVAVPRAQDLKFFGNAEAERLFHSAVERISKLGVQVIEIDYTPFARVAELLYQGPWVAERRVATRDLSICLPVIQKILAKADEFDAVATFQALYQLETLRQLTRPIWKDADVLLVPTAGTIYTHAQIEADPIALNSNLGYYTNFVNLLDLCAIAVPNGFQQDGLPAGVTLIAPAGHESALLDLAGRFHQDQGVTMGATGHSVPPMIRLAVVGAHLSGQPLNHQLTERNARLVRSCKTAPVYRLFALPGTTPPKPGMVRTSGSNGGAIEVEVWEMSAEHFGTFVAAIPQPLGIGTVDLEDGEKVKCFICEDYATAGAKEITSLGGWRKFVSGQ